jgi:hypothetical protein
MTQLTLYRVLTATLGIALLAFGAVLTLSFFGYQQPGSTPGIPTGPVGYYFIAFTGCALIAWGGGLISAARAPLAGRGIGTASAIALVLMAIVRMAAWLIGDYYTWLGDLPRFEAGMFLLLALAFVWLRPAQQAPPSKLAGMTP